MKKLITLTSILLFFISAKAQISGAYAPLIDEKDAYYATYSSEDYKSKYHQEYAFYYKTATTKDSQIKSDEIKNELPPWEIIKRDNPKDFFNQIINSIKVEDFGDDKLNISLVYNLSAEQIREFQQTRGIVNKEKLVDLLRVNILSTEIYNKTDHKKIELGKSWTPFCCNLLPNDNPTQEKFIYYNYIKSENINFKNLTGTIAVQLQFPTEYIVKYITQKDVGTIIEIAGNQKIKLIEFVDNKIHFEVQNKEKLKSEIKFADVSSNVKSISMPKYYYNFFRSNPKMKYAEFEKEYHKFVEKEEDNLDENMVYIYSLEGKPDRFYIYGPSQKTMLSKEITLKM